VEKSCKSATSLTFEMGNNKDDFRETGSDNGPWMGHANDPVISIRVTASQLIK
jgi:hypothetical protein